MNKLGLIIKREYRTRVIKKSFIVLSIITPMLISLLIMLPVIIQKSTFKKNTILIVDNTFTIGDTSGERYPAGQMKKLSL